MRFCIGAVFGTFVKDKEEVFAYIDAYLNLLPSTSLVILRSAELESRARVVS